MPTRVLFIFLASLALIGSDWVGSAFNRCDFLVRGLVRLGWIRLDWPSSNRVWGKPTARGARQFENVPRNPVAL